MSKERQYGVETGEAWVPHLGVWHPYEYMND